MNPYCPPFAQPPRVPFMEGQSEWTHLDSLRWGDGDAVTRLVAASEGGALISKNSKQLTNLHVPRPLNWVLQFNVIVQEIGGAPPATTTEVAPLNVDFSITVGCGQAKTTFRNRVTLTAGNKYDFPPPFVPPQLIVPACDLNVIANVNYTATVAGNLVVEVASLTAPYTRLDWLREEQNYSGR